MTMRKEESRPVMDAGRCRSRLDLGRNCGITRLVNPRTFVITGFLLLYVGSYLILSAFGQYSSARATSIFATIRVDWAPVGFVTRSGQWNYVIHAAYLPLYELDRMLWHCDTYHPTVSAPLRFSQ